MHKTSANMHQTCTKNEKINAKINENRTPEMGLCRLSGVFGTLGSIFWRGWVQDARSWGHDGNKLRPRWALMASRWPSWVQLGRIWDHLGRNLDDLGRVWGGQKPQFSHFFRCFFDIIFEARFRQAKNCNKNAPRAQKAHR